MQETYSPPGPSTIRLNRTKLDELRRANDIDTEAELARVIGVAPETLWRVSTGKVAPSTAFIARTLVAFPHTRFETLFTVTGAAAA